MMPPRHQSTLRLASVQFAASQRSARLEHRVDNGGYRVPASSELRNHRQLNKRGNGLVLQDDTTAVSIRHRVAAGNPAHINPVQIWRSLPGPVGSPV